MRVCVCVCVCSCGEVLADGISLTAGLVVGGPDESCME